jgi:CubicO group peptidase (beta-lactamase class C family)/D-alanyl-D-alanine dipeptidase
VRPRSAAVVVALALQALAGAAGAQDSIPAPPPYKQNVALLATKAEQARIDHEIPALAIALVAEGRVIWARGFGWADSAAGRPATAATLFRAGSVSKPFTALGVLRLVERGRLALDSPVTAVLPGVAAGATVRQLLAHRAGMQREPSVGHYLDATSPSLAATAASLRGRPPVFPPGTRFKYSNAGFAVAGHLIERVSGEPFPAWMQREVLAPLGMHASGFAPDTLTLAAAVTVTAEGRRLPAPRFALGEAPAADLATSALDLGSAVAALLQRRGPVSGATLDSMWQPQFSPATLHAGYGLGFRVSALDGRRRIGHSGAVHGFVSELALLPEAGVGVVVLASRDLATAVAATLATDALRLLLGSAPDTARSLPLPDSVAARLTGRWASGSDTLRIRRRGALTVLERAAGIARSQLRLRRDTVMVDDPLYAGPRLLLRDGALLIDRVRYLPVADPRPLPAPARWQHLLGEYGPDFAPAHVLEEQGRLVLLMSGAFRMPLRELARDSFALPDGLFDGDVLIFERDERGHAVAARVGGARLERRRLDGEDGATFRINPRRPVEELRREALAARPPVETGDFRASDLLELRALVPDIRYDIRYATADNFMGAIFYSSARAFLQRPAAEALARAATRLRAQGYGLLIHDAYRPWYVTRMFWDATPEEQRDFVADPARGSRHNRGAAVDLSLYELRSGRPVDMVSGYDEFSPRAYPDYPGGTALQRWYRELLRSAMEAESFTVYPAEWWHFDHPDWRHYRIGNERFEELAP